MTNLLQQAINNLSIHDVYLTNSHASIPEGTSAKYDNFVSYQTQVKTEYPLYDILEFEDDKKILRVKCGYGIRWISSNDEKDIVQRAVIEASFVAEYSILNELDESAIAEFIKRNVHHHVWPYWREFVASQTERMRLPRFVVQMVQFGATPDNKTDA